jgi:hypothetical protein
LQRAGQFDVISEISGEKTIAVGNAIDELARLQRMYGQGRWLKRKGTAYVRRRSNGYVYLAEVHWYEAHGIGRFEFKVKYRERTNR